MENEKLKELLRFCIKKPGSYLKIKNIIYAPKLFFINSVLFQLQKNLNNGLIDDAELNRCIECVYGYIGEEHELSFDNGTLQKVY